MTHEPPRKPRPSREPDAGDGDREETTSDRPTVSPPFDVEAFARATGAPERDPVWPPRDGSDRSRQPPETPTARPPPLDAEPRSERGERITLTNEAELEKALAKSVSPERTYTPPARAATPAAPRAPSFSALAVANERASSAPEIPVARAPTPSSIEAAVLGAINNAPEITERTIEDPIEEMRERLSLGDYTGALEMAEILLTEDPSDPEVLATADKCRKVLESMYAARLGPLDRVPSVAVQRAQLRWLSIDHRAGFVLSLVDGSSTLEMILDVCGMPRLDAMRILDQLVQQRIVSLAS
jgi:hypothetical protein